MALNCIVQLLYFYSYVPESLALFMMVFEEMLILHVKYILIPCHYREERSSSKRPHSHQRDSNLNSSSDAPDLEVVGRRAEILTGRQSNLEKVDEMNSNATEESTYRVCFASFQV